MTVEHLCFLRLEVEQDSSGLTDSKRNIKCRLFPEENVTINLQSQCRKYNTKKKLSTNVIYKFKDFFFFYFAQFTSNRKPKKIITSLPLALTLKLGL